MSGFRLWPCRCTRCSSESICHSSRPPRIWATRFQTFTQVVLPLSIPGVVAAFVSCFIPTIGEYVTPLLVGGSKGSMYGNLIQDYFTKAANWPLGAALSLVMLLVTLVFTAIALRTVDLNQVAK